MVPVASRASAEPTALVIVMIGQPLSRAALTAPMVSAVSPDWETATTSVSGPAMASRYRYSDARSASAGKPASEGIGDGPRLLVDLLEHEVPVATLLGHDRIPHDSDRLALHRLIVERREHHAAGRDDGHLTVLEDHDVARVAQDRRDIGGDEHLALAEAHDHSPRAVLGGDETVGRTLGADTHRVRACQL